MAMVKVEGGRRISLTKQEAGSSWEGILAKKYEISSAMSKTGKQWVYTLDNGDGTIQEFYGCASLDNKMAQVPENSVVKITLTGFWITKSKQNAADVEVEYDDGK